MADSLQMREQLVRFVDAKIQSLAKVDRPALLLAGLLVLQLLLGAGSYGMKLAARDAPQPLPPVVAVTTAHVAVGALVLAASLLVTLEVFRKSGVRSQESEWKTRSRSQESFSTLTPDS